MRMRACSACMRILGEGGKIAHLRETFSPRELYSYLKQEIPTLSLVDREDSDGEVFLALNDEYVREIAPLLGDRLKIERVLCAAITKSSSVRKLCMYVYVVSQFVCSSQWAFF